MRNLIERGVVYSRALKRQIMWHWFSNRLPIYLVPEFPKSGGTWFSQMLSECLGLPFARNTNPAKFQKCVMTGHHLYHPNFHNATVVIRDGRDVMVSAYYYMLFKNEINRQFGVDRHRRQLPFDDYEDIRSNLPSFIEYMFTTYATKRFHFSWSQFVDSWLGQEVPVVRYEDLLQDAASQLVIVTRRLTGTEVSKTVAEQAVEKYSFKNISGRKVGDEDKRSFVRKGIAGDWKNHFAHEACVMFDAYAGEQLIKAGYEADRSWVEKFNTERPETTSALSKASHQ